MSSGYNTNIQRDIHVAPDRRGPLAPPSTTSNQRPGSALSAGTPPTRSHLASGYREEVDMTRTSSRSAQQGPSAIQDFAAMTTPPSLDRPIPKAGFLGQWLTMLNTKPPSSRAVSPMEDENFEDLLTLDPSPNLSNSVRQGHRSNETLASRRMARTRSNKGTAWSDNRASFENRPRKAPPQQKRVGWFGLRRM